MIWICRYEQIQVSKDMFGISALETGKYLHGANLIGVLFKLAELNALFQLNPPDRSQVLDVDLALLDVFEEHLNASLSIVLAVGHQVNPRAFEMLKERKKKKRILRKKGTLKART